MGSARSGAGGAERIIDPSHPYFLLTGTWFSVLCPSRPPWDTDFDLTGMVFSAHRALKTPQVTLGTTLLTQQEQLFQHIGNIKALQRLLGAHIMTLQAGWFEHIGPSMPPGFPWDLKL